MRYKNAKPRPAKKPAATKRLSSTPMDRWDLRESLDNRLSRQRSAERKAWLAKNDVSCDTESISRLAASMERPEALWMAIDSVCLCGNAAAVAKIAANAIRSIPDDASLETVDRDLCSGAQREAIEALVGAGEFEAALALVEKADSMAKTDPAEPEPADTPSYARRDILRERKNDIFNMLAYAAPMESIPKLASMLSPEKLKDLCSNLKRRGKFRDVSLIEPVSAKDVFLYFKNLRPWDFGDDNPISFDDWVACVPSDKPATLRLWKLISPPRRAGDNGWISEAEFLKSCLFWIGAAPKNAGPRAVSRKINDLLAECVRRDWQNAFETVLSTNPDTDLRARCLRSVEFRRNKKNGTHVSMKATSNGSGRWSLAHLAFLDGHQWALDLLSSKGAGFDLDSMTDLCASVAEFGTADLEWNSLAFEINSMRSKAEALEYGSISPLGSALELSEDDLLAASIEKKRAGPSI